ncbi:MAG TPA: SRPBCC domain-containing protein, partial [Phycisphaerae bacterium]|nr:SRPBCC domain-containing protein [Phycisphaerae bacterium]
MTSPNASTTITAEISIRASADRVFNALTDPRQQLHWWNSPGRFHATHAESDLRPGGAWLITGIGIGGKPFTLRGVYTAIQPPHLLEFTWNASFANPAEPETRVRFDLAESHGTTTLKLTHSGFPPTDPHPKYQGWPTLLSQLQSHTESPP